MSDEKPHIYIVNRNERKGNHVFNFENFSVPFSFSQNADGVVLEFFPPVASNHKKFKYEGFSFRRDMNVQSKIKSSRRTEKRKSKQKKKSFGTDDIINYAALNAIWEKPYAVKKISLKFKHPMKTV